MESVSDKFIERTVVPFITTSQKVGNISEEVASKSINDARALLLSGNLNEEQEKIASEISASMQGSIDSRNFGARSRVFNIIGQAMLVPKIQELLNSAQNKADIYQTANRFRQILDNSQVNDSFFIGGKLQYGMPSAHSAGLSYWDAFISTGMGGNIVYFSGASGLREEYLREAENTAQDLFYYPHPNKMVATLISGVSSHRDYKRREILFAMAQTKDWQQLVNWTVRQYPQLENVREELLLNPMEIGENRGQIRVSEKITSNLADLKKSLILGEDNNLKDLAIQTSSTRVLLEALSSKNLISDADVELLANGEGEIPELRRLLNLDTQLSVGEAIMPERIDRVKMILEKIGELKNQKNENLDQQLQFYYINEIQKFIVDTTNSQEIANFVLELPTKHPQILGETGTFIYYMLNKQDTYLNPEGVEFMIKFVESYSDFGDFPFYATSLLGLVERGIISRERIFQIRDRIGNNVGSELLHNFSFIQTDEGLDFVLKFRNTYKDSPEYNLFASSLLEAVEMGQLERDRILDIRNKIPDNLLTIVSEYPLILKTDQDIEYYSKFENIWGDKVPSIKKSVRNLVYANIVDKEVAISFLDKCGWISDENMGSITSFVLENPRIFLQSRADLDFLNSVVGKSGVKSMDILKGYLESVDSGVISSQDRQIFLDFIVQFRAVSPVIIKGYKDSRESGNEEVYISRLKSIAEKLIGKSGLSEEDTAEVFYKDLIKHVYPNNSNQWSNYEKTEACLDRTSDLFEFTTESRYDIDLLSQSEIKLKNGESISEEVLESLQEPVYSVQRKLQGEGGNPDVLKIKFDEEIDEKLKEMVNAGSFKNIDVTNLTTDQKFFLLMAESIYGKSGIDSDQLKNMIVTYEFVNFEDIGNFIQGTQDRISRASNREYALLCELSQFYSDHIKDVNKKIIEAGFGNPEIANLMMTYFTELSHSNQDRARLDKINKLQLGKLGASPGFISQVSKTLERKNGKKYTTAEIESVISRYESMAGGLTEKTSTSSKKRTQAFYGMLRSQREKTFQALKEISGVEIDPKLVHLGEINLQEALQAEAQIESGVYDEKQFASYTAQKFIDIFEEEQGLTEENLQKFESESGTNRELLYAYITKTHESANARMVGGVCVSGDNPNGSGRENMWDMPNYFQLVFQDPENLQCQGLVLMHHFTDQDGKRILAASLNPSSTYLYSVDEGALFKGIMGTLEKFAYANRFDVISLSKNRQIRTNRTGGEFEKAIDDRIRVVDKAYSFDKIQTFSYSPSYSLKDMDIIWERPVQ